MKTAKNWDTIENHEFILLEYETNGPVITIHVTNNCDEAFNKVHEFINDEINFSVHSIGPGKIHKTFQEFYNNCGLEVDEYFLIIENLKP